MTSTTVLSLIGRPESQTGPAPEILESVERLADRSPTSSALRAHGLHLFAARRLRMLGQPPPDELLTEEHVSAMRALAVPLVLERVRAAYDGQLILMKGPEVAALYPDPALRPFSDLDILADDPHAAQDALVASGFAAAGTGDALLR